ncbi:MAG: YfhO family protein [Pirellulaceae bacterium]
MISSPDPVLHESRHPWLQRCLLVAVVLIPWWWLFGPSLATNQTVAFRDAAHFHYPTFHWATQQWRQGQVPLWNHQENLGSPTMSDLSSSLFYPGKLVFQLPLPYPRLYSWYIALHVLLAAYGTYRLASYWQASSWASLLAATSYAFCGSLLSQHANVIYLVSASWIPFALQSTDQMLVRRDWKSALSLALFLGLMTLGGDPQSAYHGGLIAGLYALVLSRRGAAESCRHNVRWFEHRFVLLLMAGCITFLITAIQVLPSLQWTRQSLRNSYTAPHSLYEILPTLQHRARTDASQDETTNHPPILSSILTSPPEGSHHHQVYHFSIGPWRFGELIWPNFSGKMYPVHRRWMDQLPAEGRVWSATLYLGWLPLILACAAWNLRSSDPTIRWLSYLVLLSMLASLGWFGLGWLLHEIQFLWSGEQPSENHLGKPVGGVYWLLVQLMPGYVHFRYPAKWFIIASMGISLLAAKQFDIVCQQGISQRLRTMVLGVGIFSGLAMMLILLLQTPLGRQLAETPFHAYWGPLDRPLAIRDMLLALGQTATLSLGTWYLLRKPLRSQHRWVIPAAVCFTVLELGIANGWLLMFSADRHWQAPALLESRLSPPGQPGQPPKRIFRSPADQLVPGHWSTTSSLQRQEEIVAWDRSTLLPRYHLLSSAAMVRSPGSIQSRDDHMAWTIAGRHPGPGGIPSLSFLRLLGVHSLILPRSDQGTEPRLLNVQWKTLPDTFPRSWIAHEVIHFPPLKSPTPAQLRTRTEAVFFPGGEFRDFQQAAVIESVLDPSFGKNPGIVSNDTERCQIVDYEPQRVRIQVHLKKPGMVVLSDRYDIHWTATVASKDDAAYGNARPCPVYRTNRLMRGVYLPTGDHEIIYQYQPSLFRTGSIVSFLTCLALAGSVLLSRRRRRHKPFPDR